MAAEEEDSRKDKKKKNMKEIKPLKGVWMKRQENVFPTECLFKTTAFGLPPPPQLKCVEKNGAKISLKNLFCSFDSGVLQNKNSEPKNVVNFVFLRPLFRSFSIFSNKRYIFTAS